VNNYVKINAQSQC